MTDIPYNVLTVVGFHQPQFVIAATHSRPVQYDVTQGHVTRNPVVVERRHVARK